MSRLMWSLKPFFYKLLVIISFLQLFYCQNLLAQYKKHEYVLHITFKSCQVQQFLVVGYWQDMHIIDSCFIDANNVEKYFRIKTSEKNAVHIQSERGSQIEIALEKDTTHIMIEGFKNNDIFGSLRYLPSYTNCLACEHILTERQISPIYGGKITKLKNYILRFENDKTKKQIIESKRDTIVKLANERFDFFIKGARESQHPYSAGIYLSEIIFHLFNSEDVIYLTGNRYQQSEKLVELLSERFGQYESFNRMKTEFAFQKDLRLRRK